jgi:hypothetical protein
MKLVNTFIEGKVVSMTEEQYELHLEYERGLPSTHDEGIARQLEAWGTTE